MGELLQLLMDGGAAALNIVPDRNWNIADAETKRISALAAGLQPDQIHDMVMGTLHAAIASGDILGSLPAMDTSGGERGAAPAAEGGQPAAPQAPQPGAEGVVSPGQGYSPLTPAWDPAHSDPGNPVRVGSGQ